MGSQDGGVQMMRRQSADIVEGGARKGRRLSVALIIDRRLIEVDRDERRVHTDYAKGSGSGYGALRVFFLSHFSLVFYFLF